ncbi:hypothetical protein CERZMDRAFT_95086 [Cercospora zeae-maydis SCOH1-5]|uniref:Uncharacterized protein n=1 Tax=Cercospora zeae-maydis SCOH1-5 TaxID=717836 RepID=A0A6A6FMQ9_9PEZI|nr:hypothetical protein CERZMDRAFT_95086 [Cercospora zeae-maydis SCOH1-5]
MERRTTLLVHAGASSSRTIDERHVQQVEAYLALGSPRSLKARSTGHRRVELAPPSTTLVRQSEVASGNGGAQVQHDDLHGKRHGVRFEPRRSQDSSEYIDDTQLACTALESQLFTASTAATAKRLKSPTSSRSSHDRETAQGLITQGYIERIAETSPAGQDYDTASMLTSPRCRAGSEAVAESSYVKTPRITRSAKRVRRLSPEHARSQLDSGSRRVQQVLFSVSADAENVQRREQQRTSNGGTGDGTVTSDDTTSELPTSYSLSDFASNSRVGSKQDRPQLASRSVSDPGPMDEKSHRPPLDMFQSTQYGAGGGWSGHQDGPKPPHSDGKSCTQLDGTAREDHDLQGILRIAAQPSSRRDMAQQSTRTDHLESAEAELYSLAAEIHPPKPTTSIKDFTTHATEELSVLHRKFLAHYSPIMTARRISIHERGHWSVDCSSWRTLKKLAFWRHLQSWIGNGTAGHGIWCTRRADSLLAPRNRFEELVFQADSSNIFEHVRVYCWGELVEHVYLLLYTASEGGVRKLGLKWIDSKGDTIVQMKGPMDHG